MYIRVAMHVYIGEALARSRHIKWSQEICFAEA